MLHKKYFFGAIALWTLLFNVGVFFTAGSAFWSVALVFPFLMIVPGLLVLLVLQTKLEDTWKAIFYSVALSLVCLMGLGMAVNWMLPMVGMNAPLSQLPVTIAVDVVVALLWVAAWLRVEWMGMSLHWRPTWRTLGLNAIPVGLVVLSAMGATALNNGGTNWFTIAMLLGVLADFILVCRKAKGLPARQIIFHVLGWSLALLLMNSLRGWFITGHDIQREYYVFQVTLANWHWDISSFKDPYNACLSITILPTMLASLIHINDAYIYKLLFQIIFAMCPVGVYLLARTFSTRRLALLSVLYFIAFPTFFSDMSMLNRQEIAFVLFTGMLLVLNDHAERYAQRMWLFILFGLGVVVAHYSTTYSTLAILVGAWLVRIIFERRWFTRFAGGVYRLLRRDIPQFLAGRQVRKHIVVLPVILLFATAAFLWNVQITQTSRGLVDTLRNAALSISGNIHQDLQSTDTKASLFGGSAANPEQRVQGYVKQQESQRSQVADQSAYYPQDTYQQYPIHAAADPALPATGFGSFLAKTFHLDLYNVNYNLRQGSAKVLQMLVVIGLLVIFFSHRRKLVIGTEIMAVSMTSIVFLAALVFVPVLSLDYGLLRAFQQVLVVLALPTVLGSLWIFSFFREKVALVLASAVACFFFATSTGLVGELTGGYVAQLHLHNSGMYYDSYYIRQQEVQSIIWLSKEAQKNGSVLQQDLEADRFAVARLSSVARLRAATGIYPGLILKDAYVYLGTTNVTKQQAFALYLNEGVGYTYPLSFLDLNKNLVYSNGLSYVYK